MLAPHNLITYIIFMVYRRKASGLLRVACLLISCCPSSGSRSVSLNTDTALSSIDTSLTMKIFNVMSPCSWLPSRIANLSTSMKRTENRDNHYQRCDDFVSHNIFRCGYVENRFETRLKSHIKVSTIRFRDGSNLEPTLYIIICVPKINRPKLSRKYRLVM